MRTWRLVALLLTGIIASRSAGAGEFVGSAREYALAGAALLGAAALEQWPPNDSHPLIGGGQKPYIEREHVPDWALVAAHVAAFGTIRYGPGGADRTRYAHGYAMAVSLTQFSTSLVKGIVGRRRPNYEDAKARGLSAKSESFYSGHASTAFCLATYAALYSWHRTDRPLFRAGVPIVLYGVATYTAWSRVAEHRHYPSDVIAGAAAGSIIAAAVFRWYDGMTARAEKVSLAPAPGGLLISVRF